MFNGKIFIIIKYYLIIEEFGWYKWKFNIGIKSFNVKKYFMVFFMLKYFDLLFVSVRK